ncbi:MULTISPECIES: flagellar export protein FliJ [Idiomarina]|mgnify:CR=1 FL=1|jgi:flagellar FliJ protein|uniref:Flagellar FliJ protein n=2 Tax=Idiomarina baltica TaxID=190892 RepID=A0A348WL93_9GAMM|nr:MULTISPECIES: flagellar export protein FliJ [Idiomarina]MEC8924774.1 flagellar export protein FliJ [Pseudomonadota bacterium]EAQ32889.1 Flagellar biosynthesis chaperone [Idiomarina baltica OS145]KXS34131.1 MAG: flagellar biosynthesis chaperone [Idiomarina sp. T82-3]MBR37679.1 flagellar export protein FliJ [Idiomarina sp.]HAE90203.1 flagellar export protein FliJ [Idiomarina sp.]|tara:strand:+ start:586 stop:1041 length:456 start_codon:yes stop_codon:yes gene_type:complete
MADISQLTMLLELEQQRTDKLAQHFGEAKQRLVSEQQRLDGLVQYRLDYLNQLQARGAGGIRSIQFGQYHAFVGKLDEGIEQMHNVLQQLNQVVEQRKQQWLAQRQKAESIELLIENKKRAAARLQARKEQKNLDDFSTQRFIRGKKQKLV